MVLHDHASTTYGIVRNSILNESTYFHVVDGLVPDIKHDVLQGCAPYMVKELVKYIISEHIIMHQELNYHITMFPYSPIDARNKPTVIPSATLYSSDHSVKQKGDY